MKSRVLIAAIVAVAGLAVLIQMDQMRSKPAPRPAGPPSGPAPAPETAAVPEAGLEEQWRPSGFRPRPLAERLPPVSGKMSVSDLQRHVSAALAPVEELEKLEPVARTAKCYERNVEGVAVDEAVYRDPSLFDDFGAGRVVPTDTGTLVRRCATDHQPLTAQWRADLEYALVAADDALLEVDRKILEQVQPGEVSQTEALPLQKVLRKARGTVKAKRRAHGLPAR